MDFSQWWDKAKFVGIAFFLTAALVRHHRVTLSMRTTAQRVSEPMRMVAFGLTAVPRYLGTLTLFLALGSAASQSASALSPGDDLGDNQALTIALEHYGLLQISHTHERVPLKLAQLQHNAGTVLEPPGRHQSSAEEMELAARANDALLALTSKPIPVTDTVSTGWHNALWDFAMALEPLDIEAYNKATLEGMREHAPQVWARSQNNLGDALRSLALRVTGRERVERLRQAVGAYNSALLEWTQERTPEEWASTQYALASTLRQLAQRESGTEILEQAIEAYNNALHVWTREQTPKAWADIHDELGNALWALGQHEAGTESLELAVDAFNNALLVYAHERYPLYRPLTQENLGLAYWSLALKSQDPATLLKAMETIRSALEFYEEETHPQRREGDVGSLKRILTRGKALLPTFEERVVSK